MFCCVFTDIISLKTTVKHRRVVQLYRVIDETKKNNCILIWASMITYNYKFNLPAVSAYIDTCIVTLTSILYSPTTAQLMFGNTLHVQVIIILCLTINVNKTHLTSSWGIQSRPGERLQDWNFQPFCLIIEIDCNVYITDVILIDLQVSNMLIWAIYLCKTMNKNSNGNAFLHSVYIRGVPNPRYFSNAALWRVL